MKILTRSREFELASACCRPDGRRRDCAVQSAVSPPLDWRQFLQVVAHHRIEGITYAALQNASVTVPGFVADQLAKRTAAIRQSNLHYAAESVRLARGLSSAHVPHLFFKGTTLAIIAYGSLGFKAASDIDVLVPRNMLHAAADVLEQLDYVRVSPPPEMPDLLVARFFDTTKEGVWRHRRLGIEVDIHIALVDHACLLERVGLSSERQDVCFADGLTLPTLARDELFAYLCVHGTSSAWVRLKLVAEVAALIGENAAEAQRLHEAAVRLGGGRCSAVALALCSRLLDTPVPAPLLQQLRKDPSVRRLETTALWALSGGGGDACKFAKPTAMLRLWSSHFLLHSGWRHKATELRRRLFYPPYSPKQLGMATWLRPLYAAVNFPRWMWKNTRSP